MLITRGQSLALKEENHGLKKSVSVDAKNGEYNNNHHEINNVEYNTQHNGQNNQRNTWSIQW